MTAIPDQYIGRPRQCPDHRKPGYTTAGPLPFRTNDHRRPVKLLHYPRGHDSNHAGMPFWIGQHQDPVVRSLMGLRQRFGNHTIQVIDTVETYRDMLSGMIDIYLSSLSNRMNQVMKVLTVIATIFMPLTFLAGVYGMNFKYLPELEWHWGYLFFWVVNITIAIIMLILFKRKKWL